MNELLAFILPFRQIREMDTEKKTSSNPRSLHRIENIIEDKNSVTVHNQQKLKGKDRSLASRASKMDRPWMENGSGKFLEKIYWSHALYGFILWNKAYVFTLF